MLCFHVFTKDIKLTILENNTLLDAKSKILLKITSKANNSRVIVCLCYPPAYENIARQCWIGAARGAGSAARH